VARLSSLSAFFPAYNEEPNLVRMYESLSATLPKFATEYEIIIVNDGSRDGTGATADRLAKEDPRVRHILHATNLGYGAAVAEGFAASRYEYVFFTDGDNQFDVSQLALLVPFAAEFDAVIGYRINRQDHFFRLLNAHAWNRLVSLAFGLRFKDIDCAFKLIRRSALPAGRLESSGAMISTELLVKLVRAGCSIREVGVLHQPRIAGKQTGANPRVVLRAFRELYAFRRKLRREGP
jgi:glycosyltransferase involved in cell wall biosynthesis